MELDLDDAVEKRRVALRILERAARGQGFSQLFADTAALAKDRESSFEDLLAVFYGLLSDLLELNAGIRAPFLRNGHLAKELQSLARLVDSAWIARAIAEMDKLAAGVRRNLNRQLGLDSLAVTLVPVQSGSALRK
jgi:hypothetical protein